MPEERETSIFHQLAQAGWIAPLCVIGMNVFLRNIRDNSAAHATTMPMVLSIVSVTLYSLGFGFSVAAFCGIRRYGWRGIVIPAIIGVLLNGAMLSLMTAILFRALTR